MTELPICAAILAAETGLPESKAVSLVEEMMPARADFGGLLVGDHKQRKPPPVRAGDMSTGANPY